MYTLKINIFSSLLSLVSKKTNFTSTTKKDKKRPSKEKTVKKTPSENKLPSANKESNIYYLPVHLM
ncbi:hypothetical protein ACE193_19415 [Bernardetia sp. OM2101]|uniref:hypothetical protein n=1 Tax=Bernardetia sp. OM2101 TaxID=3344876 RepID=UPI0035CEABC9